MAITEQTPDDLSIPDDVPGDNALVRSIFSTYDAADALEVIEEDRSLYILPWCARRGGIAGYEQTLGTFQAKPIEFTEDEANRLLNRHTPRPVSLQETPAWLLHDRGETEPYVTWHARVRWAERVEPMPDPAPAIRDAFVEGVSVGINGDDSARYYAPEDIVLAYDLRRSTPLITTVFHPDDIEDLGSEHLTECPNCAELYDPGDQQACYCCGGPVCPWCGDTVTR